MPVSSERIRRRRVGIVPIVLLRPCVHTFHRRRPLQHRVRRPVAADDLVDPADPVERVVGRGVAEVGSIIGVA